MPREKQLKRFWAKVAKAGPNDCWLWLAACSSDGHRYGAFNVDGKVKRAHRMAYEIVNGPIADGMNVCHKCDNDRCVNPAHLFLGTQADNIKDAAQKNRMAFGVCHHLAKLDDDKVRRIREASLAGASQRALAREYGMSKTTIGDVVRGKTWRRAI